MPFAAFFVAFLLLLCIPRRSRKLAVCLLLGALAGLCAVYTTNARLERTRAGYAGRTVLLTAEVERADSTYFSDTVDATLWVESVNNSPAGFRITCAELPACAAGQRVQGRFTLQQPDMEERTAQYADGIALQAEPVTEKPQLTVLGESGSFRARTHRLQQKLSESLRREMHRDTGGVLAAMTVGDRSGLSAQLRSAYRGAGLSHVLVVSGMHVSILCGDILSVLLPYRWEQSYRRRRRRTVWKSLLALVLMGVTGFTPSVRRAAVAVWVSALGVWVWGPPDALTSLAAAGILMTAANSYAVWDIGFELSFAAVVGTVAGVACIRRMRDARDRRFWGKAGENRQRPVRRPWYSKLPKGGARSCRKRLHCRLRLGSYLPGAGAAGPECQRVGGGLQHRGAVDGAAAAFAGTGSGFCGAGAMAGTGAWGTLPGGRPAHRPIERLGGLAQHKARRQHLF